MIGERLINKFFWDWVRDNSTANSLWHWAKKSTPLPTLLNLMQPYPAGIEIEVTTRCHLKCIMCERTYWDEPDRDMSLEEFKSVVDQFPALRWIGLTGIGSSFLNKDFLKMIAYVKSKGIGVELFDSFTAINDCALKQLVELKVDHILASIDAATKETYEAIRVGGDFDKVTHNVKTLFGLKKEAGAKMPQIDFFYIINNKNIHEVYSFLDYVKSITQGEKVMVIYTRLLHGFIETKDLFVEVPEDMMKQVEKIASSYNIDIFWNAVVPKKKPKIGMCLDWFEPFIFVTGHVIPCCAGNEANRREFQKETALGNIFEQPFREIWNGERYKNLRKMIKKNRVPPPCVNCSVYRTD